MKIIIPTNKLPSVLSDVIDVTRVPRERIPVSRGVDATARELVGLGVGDVPSVSLVEHAVCERAPRPDGEQVPLEPRPVCIDVVQCRALIKNQ
jgi:hypothetical protein